LSSVSERRGFSRRDRTFLVELTLLRPSARSAPAFGILFRLVKLIACTESFLSRSSGYPTKARFSDGRTSQWWQKLEGSWVATFEVVVSNVRRGWGVMLPSLSCSSSSCGDPHWSPNRRFLQGSRSLARIRMVVHALEIARSLAALSLDCFPDGSNPGAGAPVPSLPFPAMSRNPT